MSFGFLGFSQQGVDLQGRPNKLGPPLWLWKELIFCDSFHEKTPRLEVLHVFVVLYKCLHPKRRIGINWGKKRIGINPLESGQGKSEGPLLSEKVAFTGGLKNFNSISPAPYGQGLLRCKFYASTYSNCIATAYTWSWHKSHHNHETFFHQGCWELELWKLVLCSAVTGRTWAG